MSGEVGGKVRLEEGRVGGATEALRGRAGGWWWTFSWKRWGGKEFSGGGWCRGVFWVGGQGLGMGVGTREVGIRAGLGVSFSCAGWIGTWMAYHGDGSDVGRCEIVRLGD